MSLLIMKTTKKLQKLQSSMIRCLSAIKLLKRKDKEKLIQNNNYSWIFKENNFANNVNRSFEGLPKVNTMYRSSKSKRSNNNSNMTYVDNYPTFTERVKEIEMKNQSLERSSSIQK